MIRNTLYLVMSAAARVLTALVALLVLARIWGPTPFGTFMYPYAVAGLLAVVVDYGFGLQVVRDVARAPNLAHDIVVEAFRAKVALAAVVALAVLVMCILGWFEAHSRLLLSLLVLAAVVTSFGALFNLGLRGLGRFDLEATIVATGGAVLLVTVGAVAAAGGGPVAASGAFLGSRLAYAALSLVAFRQVTGTQRWRVGGLREGLAAAVRGLPFGSHMVLGTLYFQVDTVLIQSVLGPEAVGLYQAAFRVLVAGLLVTDAVSATYLPAVAVAKEQHVDMGEILSRVVRHLSTIGLVGAAFLVVTKNVLGNLVFGERYGGVEPLLPFLGLVFFLRSAGAGYGLVLTVVDRQLVRAVVAVLAVALSLFLNLLLLPWFGLQGALFASLATHLVVNVLYVWAVGGSVGSLGLGGRTSVQMGLAVVLFVIVLDGGISAAVPALVGLLGLALGIRPAEWRSLYYRVFA